MDSNWWLSILPRLWSSHSLITHTGQKYSGYYPLGLTLSVTSFTQFYYTRFFSAYFEDHNNENELDSAVQYLWMSWAVIRMINRTELVSLCLHEILLYCFVLKYANCLWAVYGLVWSSCKMSSGLSFFLYRVDDMVGCWGDPALPLCLPVYHICHLPLPASSKLKSSA